MSNIDSIAPSRLDSVGTANPSTLSLSNDNEVSALPVQEATTTVNATQRIDLEPLMTSLREAIGENWVQYEEAIGSFMLGKIIVLVRALQNF